MQHMTETCCPAAVESCFRTPHNCRGVAPVTAAVGFKAFVHARKLGVASGRVKLPRLPTLVSRGAASGKGNYDRGRMRSSAPVVTATPLLVFLTTVADVL